MKKTGALLLIILLVLSLVACQQDTSDMSDEPNNIQTSQPGTEQEQQEQNDEQIGTSEEPPLGELLFQDERVSIYANDDNAYSVTLLYGEYTYQFEGFNTSRPYCITWETDADDDGTKELYLIHTIGTGTGVSVDALFVFEPNGKNLDMYQHDSKEIQTKFNASCSGSYNPERQTLQLSYGESSYTCNVRDFYNRDYIATATNLVLISGHIIEYCSTGNETVRLSFRLSFESESITSLSSYLPEDAVVSCLVRFNGTGFDVVEDLKFVNAPEYPWIAPEIESMGYIELKHEDSLLRFLTEVNFDGEIELNADELSPPGTPSEVCFIPQPKQDQVGKTVSIIFEPDWEESYVSFHYIYNWRTGEERLIIILAPDEINIPMLIVFKTQVGGAQALLENLKTGTSFEAEILAMVNIDYQEGNVYARNAARSTYGISECEIIDMQNFMSLAGQEYLGVCGGTSEGIFVKGICGEAISKGLQDDLDVFWQIYERFSLTELLLITSVS